MKRLLLLTGLLLAGCCQVDYYDTIVARTCMKFSDQQYCKGSSSICVKRCLKWDVNRITIPVCR